MTIARGAGVIPLGSTLLAQTTRVEAYARQIEARQREEYRARYQFTVHVSDAPADLRAAAEALVNQHVSRESRISAKLAEMRDLQRNEKLRKNGVIA